MRSLRSAIYDGALQPVSVEAQLAAGLPGFAIVGLASTSIKESSERIKAALAALDNFRLPAKKITINLAPSDLPKNGSLMDLPTALLVYFCTTGEDFCEDFFVFGELGLDSSVKPTAQLFSLLLFLSFAQPGARVIVPAAIAAQAAFIPNLELFAASNLLQAAAILRGDTTSKIQPAAIANSLQIGEQTYILPAPLASADPDFAEVKGQERAKFACLVAALGMHNILFEGSPGCGKSMLAKRLGAIMPPICLRELLEQNAYRSLNGEPLQLTGARPFRSPHRSSTMPSILGGGAARARVGEIALAHGGLLFFDEFALFSKPIIEALREPLEDGRINISRVNSKISYKTQFLFVAAMNPCPCGARFKADLSCTCSPQTLARYTRAISEPIYDRIDLYVAMDEAAPNARPSFSSAEARERVLEAFKFARSVRGQEAFSGKLSERQIAQFCSMDAAAAQDLERAVAAFGLSERAKNKVLKVARSVADLALSEHIGREHIRAALSYRRRK